MLQPALHPFEDSVETRRCADEISVRAAFELQQLGMGEIIDVRQPWELDYAPTIPVAAALPLYTIKGFLGHPLSEEEREEASPDLVLAAMPTLINMLNQHRERNPILVCICRSGNRSLEAVSLLRFLGYPNALSVAGGITAWTATGYPILKARDAV